MSQPDQPTDEGKEPKRPIVANLPSKMQEDIKRIWAVKLSLKLGKTYDFVTKKGKGAYFYDGPGNDKPNPAGHSYTTVLLDNPQVVKEYKLGQSERIELPLGVTTVLGKAKAGKTYFAHHLLFRSAIADDPQSANYIKWFEPSQPENLREFSARVWEPDFEFQAAEVLAHCLLNKTGADLTIIDSFRFRFYGESGGATGKGGVNMGLFMELTHLDRVAAQLGKRLVILINPMTNDDNAFEYYEEACIGAVAAHVSLRDVGEARYESRFVKRRASSTLRLNASLSPIQMRRDAEDVSLMTTTLARPSSLFDRDPSKNNNR